ncbi:MAG: ATP-binding protein, partial [Ruminococcaceae bacterium]|nr:ATP-binding protein [Oscillospiraceae bacterium]
LNIKPYEATVFANETLLLSLIYNLADNAFKASSAGDTVFIGFTDLGNELLVFIKDTGRGISTENIKLLTEPFFREDKSRSRAQGGAGLGLSLCKEIVRLHGSELYIESQKGAGTTVSFRLKKGGESNDHR